LIPLTVVLNFIRKELLWDELNTNIEYW